MKRTLAVRASVLMIFLPAAPAQAATGDFTCRNASAQITCDKDSCEVETQSFTPMSLSRTGDKLELCAYSGCGEGTLDLIRTRGDLSILHATVKGGPVNGPVAVVFDRRQLTGTMLWQGFAQPVNCAAAR